MKLSVVSVGNSKGLRLPKIVLKKYQIQDEIDLELRDDHIILRPLPRKPRQGWEEAFKGMHDAGDDQLLIDDVFEDEDWEE